MDNMEDRIRRKAHELWETDGRPSGRAEDHWSQAKRLLEREENGGAGTKPHAPATSDPLAVTGVQVSAKKS
jgi:hypothetical protein